ncbi:MAG TPA: hypothetical protein VFY16_13865 [Gemmatimonadaceae bacterium]|nr:hypothetical protein [Gemmatimonadaceae bacterium]
MSRRDYAYHVESHGRLRAPIDDVFARLDGHARLASHMERPSWRMGWGTMAVHLDAGEGRAVGSRIRLDGRVFGIRLWVDEEVIERVPPTRKVWETVGAPRLLVIGPYRMGLALTAERPGDDEVTLSVFIDYALPDRGLPWLLGRLFGRWYARWCTARMLADAGAVADVRSPMQTLADPPPAPGRAS